MPGLWFDKPSGCTFIGINTGFAETVAKFLEKKKRFPTIVIKSVPKEVAEWTKGKGGRGPIILHDPDELASQHSTLRAPTLPKRSKGIYKRAK